MAATQDQSTDTPEPAVPARSRKGLWIGLGVAVIAIVAVVAVWFQPQKLFLDDEVNEDFAVSIDTGAPAASAPSEPDVVAAEPVEQPSPPAEDPAPTAQPPEPAPTTEPPPPTTQPPAPAGPVQRAAGSFVSLDHDTSGIAAFFEVDGSNLLRIEGLNTDNGPDLFVYLSARPLADGEQALDDDFIDLGKLKGNVGDQTYEIPAGTDLNNYSTVVIWCSRFSSGFGAADLV